MNKREVLTEAWVDVPGFQIAVSVPHGAVLPEHLDDDVILDLGKGLPVKMDVVMDDDGFEVELSFNRSPFLCVVPWCALRAVITPFWHVVWMLEAPELVAKKHHPGLKLVKG